MLPDRLCRLLTAYVDNELSPSERKAVLRLLRRSSEARTLLRQIQQDAESVRRLPRQVLVLDFSQQVLQRIASLEMKPYRVATRTGSPRIPAWSVAAAAAAVLLALGLNLGLYLSAQKPLPRPLILAENQTDSPPEVRKEFTSEDVAIARQDTPATSVTAGPSKIEKAPASPSAVVKNEKPEPTLPPTRPTPDNIAAAPVPRPDPLVEIDVSVALHLKFPELQQEKFRKQLQDELRKRNTHRVDLECLETPVTISRFEVALKTRGIRLGIDQDAQSNLALHLSKDKTYALYVENVTPEEVVAILQQLGHEDRTPEAKRRGPPQFYTLVINALSEKDQKDLSKLLGTDLSSPALPKHKTPLGVDVRQPLSAGTADQVVETLKQGTARPEPGETALTAPERSALILLYNTNRPRRSSQPVSPQVRTFLDHRKEARPGTIQMLLVLNGMKR
jgi:hypothetical protein